MVFLESGELISGLSYCPEFLLLVLELALNHGGLSSTQRRQRGHAI